MRAAFVFLALALALASSPAAAQEARRVPVVAVFDLELSGVTLESGEVNGLYSLLATRLAESGAFQVVPREQIRARIVELQKESYKSCYDQACQIELGRELAAEQTLSTQLTRLGEECAVTLTLYDLSRAAAGQAAAKRGACDLAALTATLEAAVEALVSQVAGAGARLPEREQETLREVLRAREEEKRRAEEEARQAAAAAERDRLWELEADRVRPARNAHLWAGGTLLVVGLVGAVVGPALWGTSMQDALDARDAAHAGFLAATTQADAERLAAEGREQDALAQDLWTGGWVSLGLGAALAVGGIVTLAVAPPLPPREEVSTTTEVLTPTITPAPGGAVLTWTW